MDIQSLSSAIPNEIKSRFTPYINAFFVVLKNSAKLDATIKTKMQFIVDVLNDFVCNHCIVNDTQSCDVHEEKDALHKLTEKDIKYAQSVIQSLQYIIEPNGDKNGDGTLVTSMLQKFLKYDQLGQTILCSEPSADNNHITCGNKIDIVLGRILSCCNISNCDQEIDVDPTRVFYLLPKNTSNDLIKQLLNLMVYAEFSSFRALTPNAFAALDTVMESLSQMSEGSEITLQTAMSAFTTNPSLFDMNIPDDEIEQLPNETKKITKWLTVIAKMNQMSDDYVNNLKDILDMTILFATNKSGNVDPLPLLSKVMSVMTMNKYATPTSQQNIQDSSSS